MDFLAFLLIIAGVVLLAVWLFIARQGDAEFAFLVDQRTEFKVDELSQSRAVLSCKVPFLNKGTQDGTLMDVFTRHQVPFEYFDACQVQSRLTIESNPRNDGYWEAMIIFKTTGDTIVVTLTFTAKDGETDIRQVFDQMVDVPVDIFYQVVARSDWYVTKTRLVASAEELKQAVANYSRGQEA